MLRYVIARHLFGYSSIVRHNSNYYLLWQKKYSPLTFDVPSIPKELYEQIKKILGEPIDKEVYFITETTAGIIYTHSTSSRIYMKIKRLLIKNKIINRKEKK